MNFTIDQEKSYKALGTNYLISAGAGSGKTQVLSERVRYLVQEKGYHINEFLILTFTKLAADEMKQRIRKKLNDINSPEIENIDNADICTFDSYALSIVKKYHYLLNLSKNIKLINESVMTIKIKKEIDRILDEHYINNDSILIDIINRYCFKDDSTIKNLIFKIYSTSINAINTEEYLNSLKEKNNNQHTQQFLLNYTNNLDELFFDYVEEVQNYENEKSQKKLSIIIENYNNANNLDERINVIKNSSYPRLTNIDPELKLIINEKRQAYKDYISNFISTDDFINSEKINYTFTNWIISIVQQLLNFDKEYKNKNEAYSFGDIAKFALKILKENEEIRLSIKNSLKTIMIDEYQDTSRIQEEFISLISSDNVYMVGDVKQSIYRFRKATPEIFIEKFINYQNHKNGELISLHENFRSRKEVLDDINTIFSKIMTLDLGGANYQKDHLIKNGNKCYKTASKDTQNQNTEFLIYTATNDKYEQEARIIAEDIISKINSNYMVWDGNINSPKLRKIKLSDFCILCDRGTNFYKFEKIFKEYKIPLYVENNVDISNNQIVLSIISLLKLVQCIENKDYTSTEAKHAFCSVSRSFIYQTPDNEIYQNVTNGIKQSSLVKQLTNYINNNSNLTPYLFIYNLIFEFSIYQKLIYLGDIKIYEKYLDNFLDTLSSLKDLDFSFDDYLEYFKQINELDLKIDVISSSSDFEAVKLMNIFKSKGLEFPVIYCANLTKQFNETEFKQDFYLSSKYGIIYPNSHLNHSIIFDQNKQEEKKEDISEKIRLLYVALTRAKEKIICLLPDDIKIKPIENITSLGDLLSLVNNHFENKKIESLNYLPFQNNESNTEQIKLNYENINIIPIEKKVEERASKKITFTSNIDLLQLGERLHLLLECIDFKNPDFTLIEDEKEKILIKNFLNSNLIKNLKNPEIYKEYEFIHNGRLSIIDCLIIEEKAIIIDYKLKNIDDEKYLNQLNVYYDYVKSNFKMETECYLYSILLGKYEKISF